MDEANIKLDFMKTTRGKDSLLVENFIYHFKRSNKDETTYYSCRDSSGCNASITLSNGTILKINGITI